MPDDSTPSSEDVADSVCSGDACGAVAAVEIVTMGDDVAFLEPALIVLSILHAFISLLILLAYYKLKV